MELEWDGDKAYWFYYRIEIDFSSVVDTRMGYFTRNAERRRNSRSLESEKQWIQKIDDGETVDCYFRYLQKSNPVRSRRGDRKWRKFDCFNYSLVEGIWRYVRRSNPGYRRDQQDS